MLYGPLPWLTLAMGGGLAPPWLVPRPDLPAAQALLPALLQAVLVGVLVVWRWRTLHRPAAAGG